MKQFVLFIVLTITYVRGAPSGDLYFSEDDVEILNIENFKKTVENSTNAWLVEFYAVWCGHCQRFSEPWKKFANEIASWRDMVRVGVVACSDHANHPICRDYGVTKYPTVKYFRENYDSGNGDLGDLLSVRSDHTAEAVKRSVIEKLVTEISEGRGRMYPDLLPYVASDVSELFSGVNENVQFVFLTIEKPGEYLGAEVALDLHNTPNATIRYSFDNNTDLINNLQLEIFPSVVVVNRKNNIEIFIKNVSTKNELKKAITTYLQEKGVKTVETIPNKIHASLDSYGDSQKTAILRLHVKNMGDVIFQTDLEAALRYSLEQEVATVKLIKNEDLDALNAYVQVIRKYFPFGYNSTDFIDKLYNLTSNSQEVEGSQIRLLVKEAENATFSSPKRFLGCLGSSPRYRGYPCSLWRLFHFLTVNSLLFNANKTKVDPTEVLNAIHGYVKIFFSCTHCSEHFQQMVARRNLTSVETLQQSVFWLWEAHNEVNVRLKGDSTEDPEYPKNLFPSKLNCPECYREDGSWENSEVLKYLKRMYRRYNVRYIGSDTKLLFPGLN